MSSPMFGVIVSGRLVQTDFQPIDGTKFLVNIPEADNINHIVVFLTGAQPFPDGMGGSVYFSWPNPTTPPSWQLLGYISNIKPSAIFRISKLKADAVNATPFGLQPVSHVAQIGVSIEPLMEIELQTPSMACTPSTMESYMEFANKMLENFFNYAASFAITQTQMTLSPNENFVPLSTLQQWYTNFQRKLQQNPNFWRG